MGYGSCNTLFLVACSQSNCGHVASLYIHMYTSHIQNHVCHSQPATDATKPFSERSKKVPVYTGLRPLLKIFYFGSKRATFGTSCFIIRFQLQVALQKQQKTQETHNPPNATLICFPKIKGMLRQISIKRCKFPLGVWPL